MSSLTRWAKLLNLPKLTNQCELRTNGMKLFHSDIKVVACTNICMCMCLDEWIYMYRHIYDNLCHLKRQIYSSMKEEKEEKEEGKKDNKCLISAVQN